MLHLQLLLLSLVAIGSPLQMALPAPEDTCAPEVVVQLRNTLEEFEAASEVCEAPEEALEVPECLVHLHNNSSFSLVLWHESSGSSEDFMDSVDSEFQDDVIHQTSLKIAAYVAQLIVFLMAYSIITADFEQYDTPEPLHKAREIQMIPLPARQNVRMIRMCTTTDESNC